MAKLDKLRLGLGFSLGGAGNSLLMTNQTISVNAVEGDDVGQTVMRVAGVEVVHVTTHDGVSIAGPTAVTLDSLTVLPDLPAGTVVANIGATGGTGPFVFTELTPLSAELAVVGSELQTTQTLTASDTHDITIGVRDANGLSFNVQPAFTIAVSSIPVVADQPLSFGQETEAGSGGKIPINTGGAITSASIDSGDPSSHWQIAVDGAITPTAAGEAAGLPDGPYVLNCTFTNSSGSDGAAITIPPEALTFTVSNSAEITSVLAKSEATLSGKTIRCRDIGSYSLDNNDLKNRPFTSTVLITRDLVGELPRFVNDTSGTRCIDINNADNVSIHHLTVRPTTTGAAGIEVRDTSDTIEIKFNDITAFTDVDLVTDYSAGFPNTGFGVKKDGTALATNVTISENTVTGWRKGIQVGNIIEGNLIFQVYEDFIATGAQKGVQIRDNVILQPLSDPNDVGNPHSDGIQFQIGGAAIDDLTGLIIERNVIFGGGSRGNMQGIFVGDDATFFVAGARIAGNVILVGNVHGITIESAKDCEFYGNSVFSLDDNGLAADINIGVDSTSGTNISKNNVADAHTGTFTGTNNITSGDFGATIPYADSVDLTGVLDVTNMSNLITRDEVLAALNMKVGGALDLDINVGAAGSGYVTFATTVPGTEGASIDTSFEGTSVVTQTLDGTQRLTGLTGATTPSQFCTVAMRASFDSFATRTFPVGPSGGTVARTETNGTMRIIGVDSAATTIVATTSGTSLSIATVYNIIVSFDFTSGKASVIWVDGANIVSDTGTSANDIETDLFTLFSASDVAQTTPFAGDVDFVWVNFGTDIDVTTLAGDLFDGDGGEHIVDTGSGTYTPSYYRVGPDTNWNSATPLGDSVGSCTVTGTFVDA